MQKSNENIRSTYNQEGFFIFNSLLDKRDILTVTESIHRLFLRQLHYLNIHSQDCDSSLENAISTLYQVDLQRYIQTISACSRLDSIQGIFQSDKIKEALRSLKLTDTLVPTGPVFHIMSSSLKIPNGYYGLEAHQDWPSMQGSLDSSIFWVPLVDISSDLNPMEIVPRSHLLGVIPSRQGANEAVIDSELIKGNEFLPVEVNCGDLVTFSSFLVHRSSHKSNGGIRIACSLRFENLDESSFIERGFPTAYQRTVQRDNMGYVPNIDDVKKVFSED